MAEEMTVGMWPTILYLLSLKQHSMMRLVRIPHIDVKRKPLTKAGRPNILVHVVAMYDAFQAILGFLCRRVLRCVFDVHTRVDAFNGMIRECTKNLVIRRTLVIKRIIFLLRPSIGARTLQARSTVYSYMNAKHYKRIYV